MNLDPIFKAKTMAVIGVSSHNDSHPANVIYNKNHFRYPLTVYPVNPKGGTIKRETLYRDITDIPDKIDLAVIAARADFVPDIMEKCIRHEVGGAVIISGGFAESGKGNIQKRMTDMAREAGFPFIGPNCLGIYSPQRIDTLFLPAERLIQPSPGNVAFVSQSGGVMVDSMVKFTRQGIGISTATSIGNKALIREIDMINYLAGDPRTRVIVLYIEGFEKNEGRRFVLTAERCPKPVVVMKGGRSHAGSKTVSSHTASMAGDYRVFSDIMKQHGILEARNEMELASFCEALSSYQKCISGKIGIITVSGGHGVVAVDNCEDLGLDVPQLSEATRDAIREHFSSSIRSIASLSNPIDLTGSALDDDFLAAANVLVKSKEVDCLLVLILPYSPGISAELGARISHICKTEDKPVIAYIPNEEKYAMLIEGFELNKVPVSYSVEGAVLMAKALMRDEKC
ncbi:MAG: CoA-binding protein [Deltaproteobacteria bacterium]|nr:CoA-binding protein [Deltaproteobacteria bacterium]